MQKVLLKWSFTDSYGNPYEPNFTWFDEMQECYNFIAEQTAKNGSYFYLYKNPYYANYENYLLMLDYEEKVAELRKEFE